MEQDIYTEAMLIHTLMQFDSCSQNQARIYADSAVTHGQFRLPGSQTVITHRGGVFIYSNPLL